MTRAILHTVTYTLSGPDGAREHTMQIVRDRRLTLRGLGRVVRGVVNLARHPDEDGLPPLAPRVVRVDVAGIA